MDGAMWSAALGAGYSLILARLTGGLFRINVLGPKPLEFMNLYISERAAKAGAVEVARGHFEREGIQLDLTGTIDWHVLNR